MCDDGRMNLSFHCEPGDPEGRKRLIARPRSSVAQARENSTGLVFTIDVEPPFRLDLTVWALRRRSLNETDRWDGSEYRRTICVDQTAVGLAVRQVEFRGMPRLLVRVSGAGDCARIREAARGMLDHMLGLRVDLTDFYAMAGANAPLDELARRFRGMQPPRFPSLFEALINGIACQQISMQSGLTSLNRLVAAFGQAADPTTSGERAFPTPEVLATADVGAVQAVGFSRAKSIAIKEIAAAAARGEIEYKTLADLDDAAARARLDQLRGVGRWTAEYVLLRGCGRLNIFPGDDVGARNNLQEWLKWKRALNYERTRKLMRRWQPYAGLVYFHLLRKSLDDRGMLTPTTA